MTARSLRAVVPPEHRWLSVLYRGMGQLGLSVRDCILGDGQLAIAADAPAGMRVVLTPHRSDRPCFARLGPFALSYEGTRELDQDGERLLRGFAHVVQKLAPHIPPRLQGFAAIVEDEPRPEHTLSKLFPFVTVERSEGPTGENVEVLLRTTPACNQSCPFCSAPDHAQPSIDMVLACIRETAALLPGAMLSLTGGEPTLKRSFVDEARAAIAESAIGSVQIQTNAVSFATRIDPRALPASARLSFFVSLHATESGIYDACTATSEQLPDALAGVERLLAAGHGVTLNTVVSSLNIGHLGTLASELPLGPPHNRPRWHLSALICPRRNDDAARYLVRYSTLVPSVLDATRLAVARGIETSSLLSSTHATVPPCVSPDARAADRRWMAAEPPTVGRRAERDHVKAECCAACAENARCPGVSVAYAERFGVDELRAIT